MESESLIHQVGGATIAVSYSDITTLRVDVIVSSDDVGVTMGGGVSAAIRKTGGEEVFVAVRQAVGESQRALGDVVVTGAGRLRHKHIFHAVVLDYSAETPTAADVVRNAVRRCFALCAELKVRSIAFPALATGTARLAAEQSAAAILVETFAHLQTRPGLDRVHIALYPGARDVSQRFFLQAKQYLELSDAARRADRAVYHFRQFSTEDPVGIEADRANIKSLRDGLNAAMVAASTDEFSGSVAPQVSTQLSSELEKLESAFTHAVGTAGQDDLSSIKLRAETLRLQRQKAFIERQRLEWEDTARGSSSDERTRRKEFLQAQELKFEQELAALQLRSRPVVLSIHGIRTRGTWQKEITPALNYAGFTHVPLDYGRFGLLRFLMPWARQKRVDAFRDAYRHHGARTAHGSPSLIAHSLGSYIVTEAIAKYNLQFDQVVLCGAIVRRDYDWDSACRGGVVARVLNDYGRLDIWARVAERVVRDAGQSGLKGFEKTAGGKVVNRDHSRFGHSDYFYEQNYTDSWIPFLEGRDPKPVVNLKPTGTNWKYLATIAVAAAVAAALLLLAFR